jgi:hypothetical protein
MSARVFCCDVRAYACMCVCVCVFEYVCTDVCMLVWLYACKCACTCISCMWIHAHASHARTKAKGATAPTITHTPAVHTRVLPLAIILVAVAPSTDSLDSHGTVRTEDSPGRMMLVFACKCAMHRLVSYSTKCSALCSQPSSQSLLPLHEPERMQARGSRTWTLLR